MATDWVRAAETLVDEVLEPGTAEVDRVGRIPDTAFDTMAERGFYGFALTEGMTPDVLIDTAATVISGCLATGFVWAQHLGALRSVAFAENAALRDRYLEPMRAGQFRCGVSYAGAVDPPSLFADPVDYGFVLRGVAPFVTGWGYIDAVIAAVRVFIDGTESIATLLIPVSDVDESAVRPVPLIAADASRTVQVTFDGGRVESASMLGIRPVAEFLAARGSLADWVNGALGLGVLARCVRQLEELGVDSSAHEALFKELRSRFPGAAGNADATYALRADIARAALDTAAAGVVATGSRATLSGSTPERLMRQATFALVCTTREQIKDALLDRLAVR
ncbi:acyl-CoA dehydrogenase [Nocardia sp. NPDC020380]|uniref:acyl-CoA dehydrogenase n=1 Tax=Nocardia sp. NPDC020380 TaxID=3364309 RepID=UPI0037ABF1C3